MGAVVALVALLAMAVGASAAFGYSEFKTSGSFPVTITGKSGKITIESSGGNSLTCEKSAVTGSFTGSTSETAKLTLSGKCEINGAIHETCPTLETKNLTGEPGENLGGLVVGKTTKDGILFTPSSGVIAEYICGSTTYKFVGGFICETAPIGKMTTKGKLVCEQTSAGKQEFTSIEIGGKALEASLKAESNLGVFKSNETLALSAEEELSFTKANGEAAEVEQTR